jgi:hypothetical protein
VTQGWPNPKPNKAAQRETEAPAKPCFWLGGVEIAALPTVILKERPFLPRMKDLNRRSRLIIGRGSQSFNAAATNFAEGYVPICKTLNVPIAKC